MIPLRDDNPTTRVPVVTILLIAANVLVYFAVQPHHTNVEDAKFSYEHAAIPCEVIKGRPLTDDEINRTLQLSDANACETNVDRRREFFPHKSVYVAIFYSMFLHGSLLHLGGNMLFLWIFGNNIEDRMTPIPYVLFYIVGGLVAAAAHILAQPNSTVPVVGASGAIAAVMGAYLVLFPNAPITTIFIFFFIFFRRIQAKWLLVFWFISQFFISPGEGVAWVAHVGGFVFGAAVAALLRDRLRPPPRLAWRY